MLLLTPSSSGVVTSVVVTDMCDYLFVAFSSGAVRVFHITAGNADPEDRYGYVLCYVGSNNSFSSMGKLVVHMEIGSSVDSTSISNSSSSSSSKHIFVAAKIGATRMQVIDLDSLRETQRSRGFITTSGMSVYLALICLLTLSNQLFACIYIFVRIYLFVIESVRKLVIGLISFEYYTYCNL